MLRAKLPFFLAYARARQQPIFIDYIEIAAWPQYIDTGIVLSYNHKVTAVVKPVGDGVGANHIIFGNLVNQNKGFTCACADKVMNSRFDGALIIDNLYRGGDVPHTYTVDKNGIVVDDEPIKTWPATPSDFTTIGTCLLSGNKAAGNVTGNHMGIGSRIYDFKVWENEILVQHLKPCLHPQTFEACMYDTVTKQYFYNKGAGSFIPAPRFVEYIEFTGEQYINTEITQQTCKVECGIEFINTGARQLMGFNSATASYWGARANSYFEPGSGLSATKPYQYNDVIIDFDATDTTALSLTLTVGNITGEPAVGPRVNASTAYIIGGLKSSASAISFNNSIKMYYNRIYNANGELVQHLRPCLRGNTPCMYDMVTGKYFYNQGTGTFGYGKTISA